MENEMMTKEKGVEFLRQKCGIGNSTECAQAIAEERFENALLFANLVEEHGETMEHYHGQSKKIASERRHEISVAMLRAKHGIGNTTEYKEALSRGEIEKAEQWLMEIETNRSVHRHYNDEAIRHRRRELEKAKENK